MFECMKSLDLRIFPDNCPVFDSEIDMILRGNVSKTKKRERK